MWLVQGSSRQNFGDVVLHATYLGTYLTGLDWYAENVDAALERLCCGWCRLWRC
jgi:hypothetical protein